MRKSRKIVFAVGTAMALTLAGCGSDKKPEEVVPTVAPTATPTIPPVTATPAPTSTPAPRKIGEKTSQSKFVYLTNNLKTDVRELYLMVSGSEDWGDNLIPREFSVKASDQVQMFYTPESVQASAEEVDSEETGAPSGALYDMKLVTADGNTYEIYSIELSDMEKASLTLDEETSTAYLRYMSLSEKKEKDTKEIHSRPVTEMTMTVTMKVMMTAIPMMEIMMMEVPTTEITMMGIMTMEAPMTVTMMMEAPTMETLTMEAPMMVTMMTEAPMTEALTMEALMTEIMMTEVPTAEAAMTM